jgi:hypothetical protein
MPTACLRSSTVRAVISSDRRRASPGSLRDEALHLGRGGFDRLARSEGLLERVEEPGFRLGDEGAGAQGRDRTIFCSSSVSALVGGCDVSVICCSL